MAQGITNDGWMHLMVINVATTLGNLEDLEFEPKKCRRPTKRKILTRVLILIGIGDNIVAVAVALITIMWEQGILEGQWTKLWMQLLLLKQLLAMWKLGEILEVEV